MQIPSGSVETFFSRSLILTRSYNNVPTDRRILKRVLYKSIKHKLSELNNVDTWAVKVRSKKCRAGSGGIQEADDQHRSGIRSLEVFNVYPRNQVQGPVRRSEERTTITNEIIQ